MICEPDKETGLFARPMRWWPPTASEVRARRDETGQGLRECKRELQIEWLRNEIAYLVSERPRHDPLPAILAMMLSLATGRDEMEPVA